ncbi:acyl carrier protein [Lactiplantibacillus pentosus]|uniref:acyl carrier protein n=1 Tax=Lactiplantibacillus pentosus TaxID=1589 RepID=UPI0021A2E02A|nr:phosphopantetheine-binding protein [Lactiplantibacillus pentosus]MCT3311097.1 acyl carrier protein [Lactiplantibacillus pentosus]
MRKNEQKVLEIVSNQLGVNSAKLNSETDIVKDYEADSLDKFEIMNEIEDGFEVNIPENFDFSKIQELFDLIQEV